MQLLETYKNPFEYKAYSYNIEVSVRPFYADELSDILSNKNVFIYKVKITNNSEHTIQLISRRWHIIEQNGINNVIEGEGVVGKQPIIEPGKNFEYVSQAILYSSEGIMYGEYRCKNLVTQKEFDVTIPPFSLDKDLFGKKQIN